MLAEFWENFRHNLFKPLLLFFYLGFLVPILRVHFEFPYVMYQALTIYLLIAIGWHGGEELSHLDPNHIGSIAGFMLVGFLTNFVIGTAAYLILRATTRMRRIDQATVAGYYGSDSAGTFVTALGVLASAHVAYEAYMPVMLAVMEIPGCLVALFLVARLRASGMDALGNMPDEAGFDPGAVAQAAQENEDSRGPSKHDAAVESEAEIALEKMVHPDADGDGGGNGAGKKPLISGKLLHEVFLNTGLYLLFGGICIGLISGLQGPAVTRADDSFFVDLFQGVLCLFLLEMGMTASRKLRDLRTAGLPFVLFGILAPNLFATFGIAVAHAYSWATGVPFELGTYVLFSVLCGAASYIAVPAVQRLAIPEASPTLPLAASLGLTFSYNVTIGIPVYMLVAKAVTRAFPVG
ncbi:sodium-dependent bicarbonate transport family permease [Aquisphaera giovannonii]|uniref:sodium-dependent bicarbonate transport family permease n=1 Tax=Aquisphaera giovannonii TaxID=406548 RepID=UPI0011E00AD5